MDNQKTLTVFTPTYNRKQLLRNCYESLKRQTCDDFLWLIVDDGSEDGTGQLVREWMELESGFEIRYIRKSNDGLHTAYNAAIEVLDTELAMCVDSDDYLTDDAVERILKFWSARKEDDVAGIVALNRTEEKEILGCRLPELPTAHIIDLYCKHGCRSDLKMIYRTEMLKSHGPIPVFGDEKYLNPYYLFLKIDRDKPMLLMNQSVCVVNYQKDGMHTDILRQYVQSPRSFAELRRMMVSMERASLLYVLKNTVHLVSSALMAHDLKLLKALPHKVLTAAAFFPGMILAAVIKISCWCRYGRKSV